MEFTRLADKPVPVWTTTIDVEQYAYQPPIDGITLLQSFDLLKGWPCFRCVSLDRLPVILTTGIDVEPTRPDLRR